jgi:alpha,alpha-trehalase
VLAETGVVVQGTLNRYWDDHPEPREESYHEDFSLASGLSEDEQKRLYRNIRAACESGWDFTCRWFADGKSLSKINTTNILPVDLNSLLWHLERRLAEWIPSSEPDEKRYFRQKASKRNMLIQALMWNEASGFFHDVVRNKLQPTKILSLAGVYPLFCGLATQNQADRIALRIEKEFLKPGGLVSSLQETGQQWDYPNGWAPLQWICYKGFKNYNQVDIARKIRRHWLYANDVVFEREKKMVEKYNVVSPEGEAGGGEYPLQDGFGWSNGIYAALYDEK